MDAKKFYMSFGDKRIEGCLYDAFFSGDSVSSPPHKHGFTEIHFTERGTCRIIFEDGELLSEAGTVTAIPAGRVHSLIIADDVTSHRAFLINYGIDNVVSKHYPKELFSELGTLRAAYRRSGDFAQIAPYLTFICKDIVDVKVELYRLDTEEIIISEFFENYYSQDVTLSDLAEQLGLCDKQTARLVEKHMGAPFSKVLTGYRINAAKSILKSTGDMTLAEVAQLVGYHSYSGFWKAFKKSEQ